MKRTDIGAGWTPEQRAVADADHAVWLPPLEPTDSPSEPQAGQLLYDVGVEPRREVTP